MKCHFCSNPATWTSPTGHHVCQSCRSDVDPVLTGHDVIDAVVDFLGRFIAYPSKHAQLAHALWVLHTHLMDVWESTPRIAFLSPEPGSGKTRALEITEMLVPNAVEAVNVTPAYLFRKVGDQTKPTILFDEIDTIFGPKARENEEIRGMLNAGHRRGAVAGRCVVKGRKVETEEIPAYCAVALAGIGDLPDTILSRSIVIRMRRRAPDEMVEPFRRRVHQSAGAALHQYISVWAGNVIGTLEASFPSMPTGIEDRNADIWEPLLAIADAVGGDWPEQARVTAVSLVSDSMAASPSLGIRLLEDLRTVFADRDVMSTESILKELIELDESPWGDLYGKPLQARGLAQRLKKYEVSSKQVRVGEITLKGYARGDLHDVWQRYLAAQNGSKAHASTTEASMNVNYHQTTLEEPVGVSTNRSETSETGKHEPPEEDPW